LAFEAVVYATRPEVGGRMPYVMVPVPEEHVQDVMQFVIRTMAQAACEPWDEESMAHFFAKIDEPSRSLLSVIAHASLGGKDLTDREVADLIELSQREVTGMVRELNEATEQEQRLQLLFFRVVPDVLPNGRTREKRVISMQEEVAAYVQLVEQAELFGEPGAPSE
jgi:hypothetical protein